MFRGMNRKVCCLKRKARPAKRIKKWNIQAPEMPWKLQKNRKFKRIKSSNEIKILNSTIRYRHEMLLCTGTGAGRSMKLSHGKLSRFPFATQCIRTNMNNKMHSNFLFTNYDHDIIVNKRMVFWATGWREVAI